MAAATQRPKGLKLLRAALATRKSSTMLAFGFSSGLPFALLIGTLNAWLGEVGVNLATIGVLSWIGLSYSFKFLWSPVVDRFKLPLLERIGRRKSWIVLCQAVMIAAFAGLASTNPATDIGKFAIFAVIAALASATQDVAVDAWRIDVADETTSVELLSAIYQFGYRIASIVGGALALVLAARMSWPAVYLVMAGLIGVMSIIAFQAPDTDRPDTDALHKALDEPGAIEPKARAIALAIVGIGWLWAIVSIARFMVLMLHPADPSAKPPSVADFTKHYGPWIIVATVIVPLIVAATLNWLKSRRRFTLTKADPDHRPLRTAINHLYVSLVAPLGELSARLGWGVLIVMGLILTYTLCYNIWSSFAFPFYLDFLHYSKDEVAFASKLFGIVMTMIGISLAPSAAICSSAPGACRRCCWARSCPYWAISCTPIWPRAACISTRSRTRSGSMRWRWRWVRTSAWCGCCWRSVTRISRPASPARRSSLFSRASSASASPRFNMPCCRR